MEINRNCPTTPSLGELKPLVFTPKPRCSSTNRNHSSIEINSSSYALHLTDIPGLNTPIDSFSVNEQLLVERDIANQTSAITRDSFTTTYSSLQTMLSQMQLKVAAAFLQETEYLQQREQNLEYEEKFLQERHKQLENLRQEREHMEEDFIQIKNRLELAVIQITKFKIDGTEILRTLFSESRQIDEKLSALISESMASLTRSRSIIHSKNSSFIEKSDEINLELNDRTTVIRNTESAVTMMLELINQLNQLNVEHSQDIAMARNDFDKKHQEFVDLSETINYSWNIKNELDEIHRLENEKHRAQQELLDQALLLENLKTVLGKAISS